MTLSVKTLLGAASIALLSACAPGSMTDFTSEAGASLDEGGFGNPTMNNLMAHANEMCMGRAKGYIVPDPIVVLDPNAPAGGGHYLRGTVRCTGPLNGKYAEVIWREYVQSATYAPLTPEATAGAGEGG